MGRELGRGGSSTVWLVTEHRSGTNYALKCFQPLARRARRAGSDVSEESMRREIRILSVLDHPHLIPVHEAVTLVGAPDAGVGLVMGYAPGGSLAALLAARGKLPVGETVTILTPIAQVLGYLHGKGFTHADVAPGNVLFTGQGKPMLSDLGIARMLGDPGSAAVRGTQGFMDPAPVEAVRAGLQPERDVYAVAALGWFCLTGDPPQRTSDRPPLSLLVPEVPRELAAALESGLNEDGRQRPTAAALATAIYRSASPAPVDLASAVHPTVLPELVTRLHSPVRSRSRLATRLASIRRRVATTTWSRSGAARRGPRIPVSDAAGRATRRSSGRHTREPGGGSPWRKRMLAAAASVAVAAAWWLGGGTTMAGPEAQVQPPSGGGADMTVTEPSPAASQQADPIEEARRQAAAPDPVDAVHGLALLRSLAFSTGKIELLAEVNQEGSPAATADRVIAARLHDTGHILAGYSSTLSQVQPEEGRTKAKAVVAVTSASSPYEEKDAAGTVTAVGAAGAEQQLRLVLVAADGRWLLSEILPGS